MSRSRSLATLATLATCLLVAAACTEPSAPATVAVASDSALVREGGTVQVDVAANDAGSVDAQVRLIGSPLHGSATASGSIVSYVPVSGYLGADSVRYVHSSATGDVDDSELVLLTDGMASSSLWNAPASTIRNVSVNGFSIGVAIDGNGAAVFNRSGGPTPYNSPAVRRADGSVQGIGSLGRYASASHMNAEGHVVGRTEYGLGSATTRPFIWTATGGMRELTSTYGSWLYGVHRINSLGWMLGSLSSSAGSTRTPGLMIGGAAVPIGDLLSAEDRTRWTILGGIAINDRGDILVHAADRLNGGELPLLLLR